MQYFLDSEFETPVEYPVRIFLKKAGNKIRLMAQSQAPKSLAWYLLDIHDDGRVTAPKYIGNDVGLKLDVNGCLDIQKC